MNPDFPWPFCAIGSETAVPQPASVSIAWSIENPVIPDQDAARFDASRSNQFRTEGSLAGLFMTNPAVAADDVMHGSFALALLDAADGEISHLQGWPKGKWWNAPLLFWDDFSSDGRLGPQAEAANAVGALCLGRRDRARRGARLHISAGLAFPQPDARALRVERAKGRRKHRNRQLVRHPFRGCLGGRLLRRAEICRLSNAKPASSSAALRESSIPAAVKDAASANLSTLATTTCFRTADGKFRGFEGWTIIAAAALATAPTCGITKR